MSGHLEVVDDHTRRRQDVQRPRSSPARPRHRVAARDGGGDISANAALAQAVAKAKAAEMPNDNVDRAIKRGTGEAGAGHYDEIWYEGYAPGGVAVYVQALTDNRNRAASDIRSTFTRNGGNLGEPGSVAYLFVQRPSVATGPEDEVMLALEAGAEDVRPGEVQHEVITAPGDLGKVVAALRGAGIAVGDPR
jgi:YebC/PmpR family DNA-binding regulatory protein